MYRNIISVLKLCSWVTIQWSQLPGYRDRQNIQDYIVLLAEKKERYEEYKRVWQETPQPVHKSEKGYVHEVILETEAEGNAHGGILIWHTGTSGTGGWQNTTMLHSIEVEYGE